MFKFLDHIIEQVKLIDIRSLFQGVVQADFAFFDPKPNDFHGVKTLLQTYLDVEEWDLSGFVDLILEQTTVGTVVKVEDDEDEGIFALVTALNLCRYRVSHMLSHIMFCAWSVCLYFFYFVGALNVVHNHCIYCVITLRSHLLSSFLCLFLFIFGGDIIFNTKKKLIFYP